NYSRTDWGAADPVNRALSVANACLYGICQSAIIAAGYSPALGFIHHGDMRSFVFDIADLYKTEVSIPVAFRVVAREGKALESVIRADCRDRFYETRLLGRIVRDIATVLGTEEDDPVSL